ncbi:MAG: threonine synthase, partial [Bacteroidota bacterium]
MRLYSTNSPNQFVSLQEAVLRGLPPDNGLYMPRELPPLPETFWQTAPELSFPQLAVRVCDHLLSDAIPSKVLRPLVEKAINFEAPLIRLDEHRAILELFHGPTLAFKDFGARFMAGLMGHFVEKEEQDLHILVATSGDTGGAVASGFWQTPGIQVIILYPSGKVSALQEKQL